MRRPLAALMLACAACGDTGGSTTLASPDVARFETLVAPVLETSCASVSCHGDAQRPLALYAPRQRRLDPAARYDKTPLTPAEVRANYDAVRGFLDAASALDTTLVRRPLGYAGHTVVFEAPSDPGCRALRVWLEGPP